MKVTAFAPGHISCFFEPVISDDMNRAGSRGAGINITLGATSEVFAEKSSTQNIEVFINNKKSSAQVTKLALKYLIGENPLHIVVKTYLDLPISQGFGMSAAGAISATFALSKIVGVSINEAIKASHFAEVQLRTGLSDVLASCFGGIEIRKSAGLPPWGLIEHIPGNFNLVLCVVGKKISTKKVLEGKSKINKIIDYGKYCTKKLLENPSIENLFHQSLVFTKNTGLASKHILEAINAANQFGKASMCMLGNSVFAMGKTEQLCKVLSNFGKIYVCSVDEIGARVL
ncbi:MAG: pantoate kinase [Thermoplasmatota archaeon]|jgi:pantoate kinase